MTARIIIIPASLNLGIKFGDNTAGADILKRMQKKSNVCSNQRVLL